EAAIEMYRAEPDSPDVEVVFHSFQLAPDLPTDIDQSALEYIVEHKGVDESRARAMQNHVTHVASTVGLEYHCDSARSASSRLAHQLIRSRAEHGSQAEVKARLFRAHSTEGRHSGSIDTLVEIAPEAGLDAEAARDAL